MRTSMRGLLAVAGSVTLGIGLLAVPASADSHSDAIAQAAEEMLHEADVPAVLGRPTGHAFSANTPADSDLWLCMAKTSISAPGPRTLYSSVISTRVRNQDGLERASVGEFEFVYGSKASALAAWQKAVTRAKKCTGTWTQSDWTGGSEDVFKATVSNGRISVGSSGPQAIWILTDMSDRAEGSNWATDEYALYVLSGNAIELTEFSQDSDDPITAKQRKAVQALAATLANDSGAHPHD